MATGQSDRGQIDWNIDVGRDPMLNRNALKSHTHAN